MTCNDQYLNIFLEKQFLFARRRKQYHLSIESIIKAKFITSDLKIYLPAISLQKGTGSSFRLQVFLDLLQNDSLKIFNVNGMELIKEFSKELERQVESKNAVLTVGL